MSSDLQTMTVVQLRKLAKEKKIKLVAGMDKASIVQRIADALGVKDAPEDGENQAPPCRAAFGGRDVRGSQGSVIGRRKLSFVLSAGAAGQIKSGQSSGAEKRAAKGRVGEQSVPFRPTDELYLVLAAPGSRFDVRQPAGGTTAFAPEDHRRV